MTITRQAGLEAGDLNLTLPKFWQLIGDWVPLDRPNLPILRPGMECVSKPLQQDPTTRSVTSLSSI